MTLSRGSHLGPYEILSPLGTGGMGEVYRARDSRLERQVAIKILHPQFAKDPDRLRRFCLEAKAASALNHPNIITVHEIGESEAGPYLVTEFIDGQTVRAMLSEGALPLEQALDIAAQASEGIARAHEAGIVHRDLKPENFMVTRDGFVKVLDFGVAKLQPRDEEGPAGANATATGMIVGTAGYLSPEQLRGSPADARSDIFSLSVVLYEMLTGANPFRRQSASDTMSAILRDEPAVLSEEIANAPDRLSSALRRGLSKKPADRFPTARAFAAELRQIRLLVGTEAPAVVAAAPPSRNRARTWRAALVTGLLIGAALGAFSLFHRSPPRLSPALPADQLAVVVLPIQDDSGDAELGRAGIGGILSDAFVQMLSDCPTLYVVSPLRLSDVSRTLGADVGRLGRDLSLARKVSQRAGGNAMLSGSFSKVGRTYVLSASLTELPSERLRATFRAESQSVDSLLQDLTGAISEKIREQLRAGGKDEVASVATASVDAYARYVRGRDLAVGRDFDGAVSEFKAALEIDPGMALAWSELSRIYWALGDGQAARSAGSKASELLDRVNRKERAWIELVQVWVQTSDGAVFRKKADEFIREFPDDRDGYLYAGLGAEALQKDCKAALSYYDKAYGLTPGYYPITRGEVECRIRLRQNPQAIAALRRYLALPFVPEEGRQQAQRRLKELNGGH
ncbi:MAG: protein kinase [Thermoanaerobaculia bacterium]